MIFRTTKDVGIVALMDDGEVLLDPVPLPDPLVHAALVVAENLGLPGDWLNNGPSSDDGGLFRPGLPEGIVKRSVWKTYGKNLRVGFIHRFDQIHFKLYAAVDQRGGYHADDLHMLAPTDDELLEAAQLEEDSSYRGVEYSAVFFKGCLNVYRLHRPWTGEILVKTS